MDEGCAPAAPPLPQRVHVRVVDAQVLAPGGGLPDHLPGPRVHLVPPSRVKCTMLTTSYHVIRPMKSHLPTCRKSDRVVTIE